jgi:predicted amidohydrolase YtcJ
MLPLRHTLSTFAVSMSIALHVHATTIVSADQIYTVDASLAKTEAFAYEDGKIIALGARAELLARFPKATEQRFAGATIVPGITDAHGHLFNLGAHLQNVDLVGSKSIAEVVERLQAFAKAHPNAKAWLIGRGWDQNDWRKQQFPSAADLDAAFPDRPVLLERIDGHALWANTAALKLSARDLAGDWQPEGGEIIRKNGKATGILIDTAGALLEQALPKPDAIARRAYLQQAAREAARLGLTGVHDAGTSWQDYQQLESLANEQQLPIRVYAMADGDSQAFAQVCPAHATPQPLRHSSGRLQMRAIKFYMDGALGSRGAALLAPYADDKHNVGLLIQSPEKYQVLLARALACGLQVNTHAIGDRANRLVLDALAQSFAQNAELKNGRHRIEHAQVLHPDDVARFAELDVIASVQPTHATSDMPWAQARLGKERLRGAYAWQSLIKAKAKVALGSDFPVEQVNPWLGFFASITRQDLSGAPRGGWTASERMTREQALHGFTLGAAYAAFADDRIGSISVGKRADFVVLDRDIMQVPAADIPGTRVLLTVVDGGISYAAE